MRNGLVDGYLGVDVCFRGSLMHTAEILTIERHGNTPTALPHQTDRLKERRRISATGINNTCVKNMQFSSGLVWRRQRRNLLGFVEAVHHNMCWLIMNTSEFVCSVRRYSHDSCGT